MFHQLNRLYREKRIFFLVKYNGINHSVSSFSFNCEFQNHGNFWKTWYSENSTALTPTADRYEEWIYTHEPKRKLPSVEWRIFNVGKCRKMKEIWGNCEIMFYACHSTSLWICRFVLDHEQLWVNDRPSVGSISSTKNNALYK